jgi:hypothetical protein
MAQIQPVKTWFQGKQREATIFTIYGHYNNLIAFGSASFRYQLIEMILIPETESTIVDENGEPQTIVNPEQQTSQTLVTDEFTINGDDYEAWTNSSDSNHWIYNFAANKLGLTIITL